MDGRRVMYYVDGKPAAYTPAGCCSYRPVWGGVVEFFNGKGCFVESSKRFFSRREIREIFKELRGSGSMGEYRAFCLRQALRNAAKLKITPRP